MRFRYLRDPLFLCCFVLYFANRFLLKRLFPIGFFHDHLNDFICLPFWVPIMLFGLRLLRLRRDDGPPTAEEIIIPLLVWSVFFKVYLPRTRRFAYVRPANALLALVHLPYRLPHHGPFAHLAVADYLDIVWFTLGALLASMVWGRVYRAREENRR